MLDAGEWLIIMQIICCDFEYGGWRSLPTIFSGRNRPGEAERGKGMDVLD
jgi:hypothetical protein